MKIVESAILSTDLAVYFKKRNSFLELVENGEFDWQGEDKKESECTDASKYESDVLKI